jgi:hypothetical protein
VETTLPNSPKIAIRPTASTATTTAQTVVAELALLVSRSAETDTSNSQKNATRPMASPVVSLVPLSPTRRCVETG